MESENVEYRLQEFLRNYFGKEFIDNKKVISISCLQFGDTGKGKFVDLFANWADMIVRPTGGPNAGHTIYYQNEEWILHSVPSGVVHSEKTNVIGSDTVIDPLELLKEMSALKARGISLDNLYISLRANLILPTHIVLDRLGEMKAGKARVGTTGKGVGPTYIDKLARRGLTMNDLLNPIVFKRKLEKLMDYHRRLIIEMGGYEAAWKILDGMNNTYTAVVGGYSSGELFSIGNIAKHYLELGQLFQSFICDTDKMVRDAVGYKNILLEGAQGFMLSIDYGTYPFVTCSDCSPAGMAKGAGLKERDIDASFGIIKGFYETRVGKGPFPTEIGGKDSEQWCNELGSRDKEKEMFSEATVNDPNPYMQGIAIRRHAGEYGATTGRPRRTGWLDLPMLRYALELSGVKHIIMTKLDVLTGIKTINLCHSYDYDGPDYSYGDYHFKKGVIVDTAVPDPEVLDYCKPVYKEFVGWEDDIRGFKEAEELPLKLTRIARYLEASIRHQAKIAIISVGPEPDETIFMP
ncbi:MAG: adenylosuccinate synthetase [Candidatus Falkowbacteria bacterium]|nr:MAG: adenylosuccinate synthetase [Candidatus Falkowbacteria bacterium]